MIACMVYFQAFKDELDRYLDGQVSTVRTKTFIDNFMPSYFFFHFPLTQKKSNAVFGFVYSMKFVISISLRVRFINFKSRNNCQEEYKYIQSMREISSLADIRIL